MSSEYQEELKDPRWDKKRKRILKRDGYKCTVCGSKGMLHVHHTYYIKHLPPWMYPDDSLLTVCKKCHEEYHKTHELTILTEHISLKGKHSKKRLLKKKKKKVKDAPPQTKSQVEQEKRKKKKQLGFNLDKLEEKLGITAHRRQNKQ